MSLKADSHDAARIYFEKVIELYPENSDARQSLDNLNNAKGLSKSDQSGDKADEKYLVSAIVSTYNAERFIRGCIEDLEAQTIADKLEIVVVNSGSGQNEEGIIKELQNKYPNIHYLKTEQRETVYAAWNRGIRAASGKYITNANTDDRHRKDAFQVMVKTLESFPAVALIYADLIITETENESFDTCSPVGNFSWLNWNRKDLLERGCFMGPQPMWRKSVHDEYGFFDDSFVTSGDYEFWLRISQTNTFLHIPVQLGLYLRSPHSIEHSNREIQRNENEKIRNLYQKAQAAGKIIRGLNPDPGKKKGVNRDAHQPVEGVMTNKSAGPVSASIIIILTSNQPKYLKQCVESIKNHTSKPCEIIFVNNNPHKSILKWLKGIIRENEHFRSINYKKTADAVKSINEGIKTSKGEYIVLMHDDVVLTDDWLPGMLECINSDPEIGVVGPMTGSKGGFKAVSQDGYDSIDKLGEYARAFREKNRHRRVAVTEVGSFCMMFQKKLVSQVGLLDEDFLADGHEVQDFCLRVRLHGYKSCIAGDVFIHHYSSERLPEKNKFFIEKWNGINLNGPMGRKLVTITIVDKAAGLFERDEIENGIKMLLEGVKHTPLEKESYYILVEMLINNKQFKDALGILNEIPFDDQDNKKPLLAGYIKEGMGEYQAAKDYVKEVLTSDHLSPIALNLEGILAYRGGDKVAAEKFFKKAIDSDPGYGDPYTNLGGLKWEIDKKGDALDLYEKGFILSPLVMDIVSNYHLAVTALREFKRAEPFFRDALLLHPHSKRIKYLLIDILIQQGKHHLALKEIEGAMITFGTDDDLLSAALKVRDAVGPMEIDKRSDQRGTISLAMIVKNEEKHLARCLASLKPVVDEIIVVDTGSNDRTRETAKVFGAKVFDFKWTDDFSEARNLSIAKASGKWIFVMDADEVLSPLDYGLLKRLVEKSTPGPVAYSVVTRNYTTQTNIIGWNLNEGKYQSEEVGSGWIPSTKVRLFPNDKRFRFEYPVHEKLEPSLKRLGIEIKKTTIPVHHYGQMNQKNGDGKGEIYYQIGKRKLDEKKDDLVAIHELAVQAGGLGKHREAIELWQRLIVLKPDSPLAFVNMGTAYLKIGKYDDALKAAKRAVELAPRMKEAINNHALCELYRGNAGQAIVILKKLLGQEPHYLSAQFIQAAAYCCNGNKERGTKAFEKLEKTITSPGLAVACHDFAKKLISAKRLDYAISLLDVAIESKNVNQDLLSLYHECGPVVHSSPTGLFSVERLYPSDTADLR